jgi:hypothetical protein
MPLGKGGSAPWPATWAGGLLSNRRLHAYDGPEVVFG